MALHEHDTNDLDRLLNESKPSKTDINHVVMDYLVNAGYPEAAKRFAAEANISPPSGDIENIQERVEIRNSILSGDIQAATERINDLTPELLDRHTSLHFSLLRLHLIELIRRCTSTPDGDITPALDFATTHLAPLAPTDPAFLSDLERTMALLIFPANNLAPSLAGLLDPNLRQEVAAKVNEAILEELGYPPRARLNGLVHLRAWAEQRARETKKVGLVPQLTDLWNRPPQNGKAKDGEDSVMGGQGEAGTVTA